MQKIVACLLCAIFMIGCVSKQTQSAQNDINGTGQWLMRLHESARFWYICGVIEGADMANIMINYEIERSSGVKDYKWKNFVFHNEKNFTYGQMVAIVEKYLKENPERWHLPASGLIVFALNKSYSQ